MINFRFHLVSLIAVFLALGLGILVGSSVVDQVIVDRLHREISGLRHESNQRRTDINTLKDQVSKLNDSLAATAPYAVQQRLEGVPVALVAERGVDANAVKQVNDMLRTAGAIVPSVVWLDDAWRLDDAKRLQDLQTLVGASGTAAATRAAALRKLAARLAEPTLAVHKSSSSTDVLKQFEDAGFVTVSDANSRQVATLPTTATRALVVTGTDSDLGGTDSLVQLVRALVASKVPTVVGEVYDDHTSSNATTSRGDAVAPVRGDSVLKKSVSTLDDAELLQGQVSAALALEQIANGTVGQYGYGRGASAVLPPPSSS
jgi:Copper transport outer membrane protein, MctB